MKYRDAAYTVAALVTVPTALGYRYYGSDEFVLNAQTFIRDTGTDSVMYYAFDMTDEAADVSMEAFLQDYTENTAPGWTMKARASMRRSLTASGTCSCFWAER